MAERLHIAMLAAGRSSRFGTEDKLAADLGGRPLIEWAARAGLVIKADARIVVTRPGSGVDLSGLGYDSIVNPDADLGLGSSIACAARHAMASESTALLILLGDMPLVSPDHLSALVARFRDDPARPIFSRSPGGRMQPPVIFPHGDFVRLAALSADRGAHALADNAGFVELSDTQLTDIDLTTELEALQNRTRA